MGSSTQVYVYQRQSGIKVSIYIGDAKIRLGSNVSYHQARERNLSYIQCYFQDFRVQILSQPVQTPTW